MTASVVVQTSFLGDTILTTPLLAQLAHRGPVDVVTTPAAASVLQGHPAVRQVIVYDKRGAHSGLFGFMMMRSRLKDAGYDSAYLAQGSMRSALLVWAARIPERIGSASSAGSWLYTTKVAHRDVSITPRGCCRSRPNGREPTTRKCRRRAGHWRSARGTSCRAHARRVGGTADRARAGQRVGLAVAHAQPAQQPADAGRTSSSVAPGIARSGGDRPRCRRGDATDALPLLASADLIGRCAVIVTNDSAPLHLASAMGTPTVAIFGPTVPDFGFGPLAPVKAVLGHETLACRPCHRHGPRRCPLTHFRCMRELSVEAVAERTRTLFLTPGALV